MESGNPCRLCRSSETPIVHGFCKEHLKEGITLAIIYGVQGLLRES